MSREPAPLLQNQIIGPSMGGEHHVDDSNCGCAQCQADDEAYDDETSECECWEYEHVDPLTGCATCGRCGARRYLSSEQLNELAKLQAEYDEMVEKE